LKYPELKRSNNNTINNNSNNRPNTSNKELNKKPNKRAKNSNSNKGLNNELNIKKESPKVIMSAFSSIIDDPKLGHLLLDSGASEHYTPYKEWLLNYKPVYNRYIIVANGDKLAIKGIGDIPIVINNKELLITNVNYVPNIKATLISSKELVNKGWEITFKNNLALLTNSNTTIKVIANWDSNAYYLRATIDSPKLEQIVYRVLPINNSLDLIYKRLNHLSKDYIIKTIKNTKGLELTKELVQKELSNCEPCYSGKFTQIIGYNPLESPKEKLSYFDSDIAGPFRVLGLKGERYFITFTCRTTRASWVYSIKYKSDALNNIINFYYLIKNQFNINIKGFHFDNALEFKSTRLVDFSKNKGFIIDYTSPYTPAQNGIAERLNRYILERLIAIYKEKNIPIFLWPYLIQAIIHIKNRTYSYIIKDTPYKAITGEEPNIGYLYTLGSLVYIGIPSPLRSKELLGKLTSKSNKGILIGYISSNNFQVYLPSNNKVISTRDIIVKEDLVYNNDFTIKEDYNNLVEEPTLKEPINGFNNNNEPSKEELESISSKSPTINNPSNNTTIITPINPEQSNPNNTDNSNINNNPSNKSRIEIQIPSTRVEPNSLVNIRDEAIEPTTRQSRRTRGLDVENKGLNYIGLASSAYLASLIEGSTNLELTNSSFRNLNENYYTLYKEENKEINSNLNINSTAFNTTKINNNNISTDKIIIKKPTNYITIKEPKSDIEALSDYLYKDY